MDVVKKRSVTRGGIDYEIRAWSEGDWQLVRAFRNGEPASLLYGVDSSTRGDFELYVGIDPVDELMAVVESHLPDTAS